MISGNLGTVRCLTWYLLWKPVGDIIRFIFITGGDARYILMCSHLTIGLFFLKLSYHGQIVLSIFFISISISNIT
ncbi:Uncharacterized protein dnm_036280 [Desulfonema magnum]|uniref:Uncharacterized protein n=2 Tax=Desulfonema magnum TaxID=45655 RepID=A0A975BM96_9BACT|nr:Uncharacterized protein dnm_036280 [Desulfonema magnum]